MMDLNLPLELESADHRSSTPHGRSHWSLD